MFLVFYRQVDKPDGAETGALKTTIGVSWGIFVAFLLGALLAYAGWRITQRQPPEPVVDGDDPRTTRDRGRSARPSRRRRTRATPAPSATPLRPPVPPPADAPARPPVAPATSAGRRRRAAGRRGVPTGSSRAR